VRKKPKTRAKRLSSLKRKKKALRVEDKELRESETPEQRLARLEAENERLRAEVDEGLRAEVNEGLRATVGTVETPSTEEMISRLESENKAIREGLPQEKRLSILKRENKALLEDETPEVRLARLEAENKRLREEVEARRNPSEDSEEK